MSKINGLGKVKLDLHGGTLLRIIHDYGDSKGLQTTEVHDVVVERPKFVKGATQQATYDMFKSGQTIEEISKERGLGISTSESSCDTLKGIDQAHGYHAIRKANTFSVYEPSSLLTHKELKETFGDKYTYGDIQLVAASLGVEDR
ncbi:MAG: helix-turn-helix domain-containing protein [Saprospiraceae bacterium]|nr:helix-turn-helix domain-containing protein [Saprospiraceae bacterium]